MDKLGIQPMALLGQAVNFLIILALMYFLVYKKLVEVLSRKKDLKGQVDSLESQAEEKKANIAKKSKKQLTEARKEAAQVVKKATSQAEEQKKAIISEAKKEAEEIVAQGQKKLARLEKKLQKQAEKDAVDLAVKIAKKLISKHLSGKAQKQLNQESIKALKKVKA